MWLGGPPVQMGHGLREHRQEAAGALCTVRAVSGRVGLAAGVSCTAQPSPQCPSCSGRLHGSTPGLCVHL